MILKRIIRHVRAQDWNAIVIEFVIVTAGVLMGIQVSNWNEGRLERARVDEQLSSLRTELQANLTAIRRYERSVTRQLTDIHALERAFDEPSSPYPEIDRKLMSVFRVGSLILETNAYEELNNSGGIRHVSPEIRSAMTQWQGREGVVQRVDQDALVYRESMIDHLFGVLALEPMVKTLAPSFEPARTAVLRNDVARLASDPKVRGFLAIRYGIETQKLQYAQDLERITERLIAMIG